MKRFSGISLITCDVPRLRNFYCDLLQVEAEGDDGHATLVTDGGDISIVSTRYMEQLVPDGLHALGYGGQTLEFEVEDVEREHQRLMLMSIPIVKPPDIHPWGRRSVWFYDPAGNLVSFYTPVMAGQCNRHSFTGKSVDNKALVQHYFERLLNHRDLSVCDELLAADYQDHDAPPETAVGPQGAKEYVADFLATYPNLHVSIEKMVAEGNRVAARLLWDGTHAQTGEPLRQVGVVMVRLNDQGLLAERWSTYMFL